MTDLNPSHLGRVDTQRLAAYRSNLDFYRGSQWQQQSRQRQLVFNYARVSIDKVTSFLMQGLNFACYPEEGTGPAILAGEYRHAVTLSRSRVLGRTDSGDRILEEA